MGGPWGVSLAVIAGCFTETAATLMQGMSGTGSTLFAAVFAAAVGLRLKETLR